MSVIAVRVIYLNQVSSIDLRQVVNFMSQSSNSIDLLIIYIYDSEVIKII